MFKVYMLEESVNGKLCAWAARLGSKLMLSTQTTEDWAGVSATQAIPIPIPQTAKATTPWTWWRLSVRHVPSAVCMLPAACLETHAMERASIWRSTSLAGPLLLQKVRWTVVLSYIKVQTTTKIDIPEMNMSLSERSPWFGGQHGLILGFWKTVQKLAKLCFSMLTRVHGSWIIHQCLFDFGYKQALY